VVLKRDSISNCNASDENGKILVPVSKAVGLIPPNAVWKNDRCYNCSIFGFSLLYIQGVILTYNKSKSLSIRK
jgi:hypothetical protein